MQEFKQPVLIEIISISAFLLTFGSPRSAPPIRFPALFLGPSNFTVFPLSVSSTTRKSDVMTFYKPNLLFKGQNVSHESSFFVQKFIENYSCGNFLLIEQ